MVLLKYNNLKNMKKLILIILFTTIATAQNQVYFGIYQDAKLSIMRDDRGNIPFTTDVVITSNWEGKQFEYYYLSVQPFYHYADLYGGEFHRYGFNVNWNFNKLIIKNTTVTIGGGLGMISRPDSSGSYQLNSELSQKISKHFELSLRQEMIKRTDLPNKKLGYNLSFGVKIRPFN